MKITYNTYSYSNYNIKYNIYYYLLYLLFTYSLLTLIDSIIVRAFKSKEESVRVNMGFWYLSSIFVYSCSVRVNILYI